mgnify:CR=1 FL=1
MEILREKLFQLESVTINHFPDPGDTEKESFIQHFRNELPKQAMWYINEIMFKDERYVFFTNDKYKTAEAHCTYCGHEYKLHERVKHKTMGVCPNCRNEIEYRNAKISRKNLYFTINLRSMRNLHAIRNLLLHARLRCVEITGKITKIS